MTPRRPALTLLLSGGLASACGGGDPAMWGLLHGHLTAQDDAVDGFLVWELYEPEWKRKRGSEHHRCARVLSVSGEAVEPATLEDCASCTEAFALSVDEVDQDCPGSEGVAQGLAAMTHLAISPLEGGDGGIGRHGDKGLRAWLSWDAQSVQPAGVVWDEGFVVGDAPAETSTWTPGRRFELWPGEIWRLRADALEDAAVADTGSVR